MIEQPNVLYLTVDSLRKDRVTPETMPYLSQLAADGIRFDDVAATAPATAASFVGLQASRYYCDVSGIGLPDDQFTTLAEAVPRAYRTLGISTNQFTSAFYNYDRGFDRFAGPSQGLKFKIRQLLDEDGALFNILEWAYQHYLTLSSDAGGGSPSYFNRPAEDVNDHLLEWFGEGEQRPFFAWLHHMDVHHPYEPPAGHLPDSVDSRAEAQTISRELPGTVSDGRGGDLQRCIELYDAECRYWDDELRRLHQALPKNTLVVVVGDHGELLGEHGRLGHPHEMWDKLVNVPLVIYHPDIESRVVESQQTTLDLAPTILDLIDARQPRDMRGQPIDVFDPEPRAEVYGTIETPEHVAMARRPSVKWLRHSSRRATQADHGEMLLERGAESVDADRSESQPGLLREMRRGFEDAMADGDTARGRAVDDTVKRHLADLGYREDGYLDAQEVDD